MKIITCTVAVWLLVRLYQTAVAERERELAKLASKLDQLQSSRDRQAVQTAELEQTVEALTHQRDARDAAAVEAASRLSGDVEQLRLALDDSSRRERQVISTIINDYDNSSCFSSLLRQE